MTKLVTILARELGEWPEGGAAAVQEGDGKIHICSCGDLRYSGKGWDSVSGAFWVMTGGGYEPQSDLSISYSASITTELAEDYATAIITREMWQAERDRLSAPEWDGEGLPPVGVECEYRSGYVDRPYTYSACRIIAHFEGESGDMLAAFTHVSHDGVVQVSRGAAGLFRPIKSQRDKWIEAACESMKDARFTMPNTDVAPMDLAALYAGALYDAGLAKEV